MTDEADELKSLIAKCRGPLPETVPEMRELRKNLTKMNVALRAMSDLTAAISQALDAKIALCEQPSNKHESN